MSALSAEEITHAVALAVGACSLPSSEFQDTDERLTWSFEDLGFDSLAFMEFCIAIQGETGVELSVGTVAELGSPAAVVRHMSGLG